MQVFMGQSWADHSQDFMERALRADRITFRDLGVAHRVGHKWVPERLSADVAEFLVEWQSKAA